MRDVVYMVRHGREYEELRYSLRSLANLPHGRVWVYGGRPSWLTSAVTHEPVRQGPVGHTNTGRIMAAIAGNRALSDEFYWLHDDMYVTEPVEFVPRYWRCTWDEWQDVAKQRKGPYGPAKMRATVDTLAAFGKTPTHSYELHVPMVVDRDALHSMIEAVTSYRPEVLALVQKRSLYGNWVDYGGERLVDDVKFGFRDPLTTGPYASTSDTALAGRGGEALRALFPERCQYEAAPAVVVPDTVRLMAGHLAGGRR